MPSVCPAVGLRSTKELTLTPLLVILTIIWFISGIGLAVCILMHTGKGTGVSEMIAGSMYSNMGGSGTIEKNLDRLTIICAVVFVLCLLIFFLIFPQGTISR